MATLEVHHGEGRVERVTITRDHQVLFGSSPNSDIVLAGEGVLPFHGRIRWQKTRYKADASADAKFLLINGAKMKSSSIRQGSEIVVGPCRIFLIHTDEDLPPDDKTRIQPAPVFAPQTSTRRGTAIERDDWFQDLESAKESAEVTVEIPSHSWSSARKPRNRDGSRQKIAHGQGLSWIRRVLSPTIAPGEERIITSPLVIGLAVSLVALVLLGFALRGIITRTIAERQFKRAMDNYVDGDYRNAIERFNAYLASQPRDPKKVSRAKVLRELAEVRKFTSSPPSWSNALSAARTMADSVGKAQEKEIHDAYREFYTDLAELVIKAGEAIADRAKVNVNAETLAEAESSVEVLDRVLGDPKASKAWFTRSRLPSKLSNAREAVRKQRIRREALAAMDAALKVSSSAKVYAERDRLVHLYPDQAEDRAVVERLTSANELVRAAVRFESSVLAAETEAHHERLGPATSLVLRGGGPRPATTAGAGAIVFALADGMAYGLDGSSGAPRWQIPVGASAPFAPFAISGSSTALAFDAVHDDLIRIDARTGALIWRQALGGPVADRPLVLGNQVIQTTRRGELVLIDLASGEIRGLADLGRPVSRSPVSDEAGEYLYVLADQDCLFIFKRDPFSCVAVEYLGHAAGSVVSTPARVGRYLVIAENNALSDGRWRIGVLEQQGARYREVQKIPVPGWTWSTPAFFGSVIWMSGDRGGIAAYAIGSYEAKNPFRLIASRIPEIRATGPAYAVPRSEEELWLSSGLSGRYALDAVKGEINIAWPLGTAGPALAPVQFAGPLAVFTQGFLERPGVSLTGLDAPSGQVRWQTVLGTPWFGNFTPKPGDKALMTLGMDARPLELDPTRLARGGFVESPLPGPGSFRLPYGSIRRLNSARTSVLVPEGKTRELFVSRDGGEARRVELPVPLGASPLFWGSDLLVPGADGRAYLIDPSTGESRAEPFVPPFERDHPTRWRSPVLLDGNAVVLADDAGLVRRIVLRNDPRPRLAVSGERSLTKEIIADPISTGGSVVFVTSDGHVHSLVARDLSSVGAPTVALPLAVPPSAVLGNAFIADRAGGVLALGSDGQRLWTASLRCGALAGPPAIVNQTVWFLGSDGTLDARSLNDGSALEQSDLGILPAGGPVTLGAELLVPTAIGTLRPLGPPSAADAERKHP